MLSAEVGKFSHGCVYIWPETIHNITLLRDAWMKWDSWFPNGRVKAQLKGKEALVSTKHYLYLHANFFLLIFIMNFSVL